MLGSEYNWLISFNQTKAGGFKVSLRKSALFTLVIAVFCFCCMTLHGGVFPETCEPLQSDNPSALSSDFETSLALAPE